MVIKAMASKGEC